MEGEHPDRVMLGKESKRSHRISFPIRTHSLKGYSSTRAKFNNSKNM